MTHVDDFARAYACPDCDADKRLTRDALGIWHLTLIHDDTCPWYRRYLRSERSA
ncbi:hypothetical protein [Microbacterium sp. NPDC058389]|uniref:hypothetical protein n=1 Tax=Microbacterium sp. NPDC058389 TaxID=3346475 RepID=UPI003648A201